MNGKAPQAGGRKRPSTVFSFDNRFATTKPPDPRGCVDSVKPVIHSPASKMDLRKLLIILCLVYIVLAFLSIFLPLWVIFGAVNEGTTGPDWELLYAGLIWWCQDTDCSRNGASRDEDAMQTLPARLFTGLFLAGGILCSLLLGLLLFNRKKVASFVVAFLRFGFDVSMLAAFDSTRALVNFAYGPGWALPIICLIISFSTVCILGYHIRSSLKACLENFDEDDQVVEANNPMNEQSGYPSQHPKARIPTSGVPPNYNPYMPDEEQPTGMQSG